MVLSLRTSGPAARSLRFRARVRSIRAVEESFCTVGDVELCYETFGDSSDQPLLLVMGLGVQMIGWHEDFCRELAERGHYVIRYDNRDVGRSTHFRGVPTVRELLVRRFRRLAYTLDDMADDAAGLLDHLGIDSAHVVGVSMGGMIAQVLALRHPERVRSLVSIMSTTGSRRVGQAAPRLYPYFLGKPPRSKEEAVQRALRLFRVIGSPAFARDERELRELVEHSFERGGGDTAGTARQLAAVLAAGNRTRDLRRISVPTLVIHGRKDRLVAPSGGRATARAIPGARLDMVDGMGHDLPRGVWPRLIEGIVDNAERAASRVAAGA